VTVTVSERLTLRELAEADAPFVLALLTDPDWLRWIGDRGVASLDDARRYVRDGPQAMLRDHGVGLHVVEVAGVPAGLCGLLRREGHADADLGFALLPAFRGQGIVSEASRGVLADARERLGLTRIVAFVSPGNAASVAVLTGLGFAFETLTALGGDPVEQYWVAL
jgi:RimJ/RimL family protein N-acetyltransferase